MTALAKDLGAYGAGVVYVADRDELALYGTKGYVGALDAAAKKEGPDAVLIAATAMGKDMAPRFAARNDVSVLADVMDLRLEGDRLVGSRPVYSGKARAEVDCGAAKLQVATTRPNVFAAEAQSGAPASRASRRSSSAISSRAPASSRSRPRNRRSWTSRRPTSSSRAGAASRGRRTGR